MSSPGRARRHTHRPASSATAATASIAGPAIGGLLLQWVGVGWCFAIDVTGRTVATLLFMALKPYPSTDRTNPPSLAGVAEGLRYALRRKDLLGTYVIDIVAMLTTTGGQS